MNALKLFFFLLALFCGGYSHAQPANDNCANAIFMNPSTHCNSIAGTTLAATPSTRPSCLGNADDDVFYYFNATLTSHTVAVFSSGGSFDPAFEVFPANCTNSQIACENDYTGATPEMTTLQNLMVGTLYYIRVYNAGVSSGTGDFRLCVKDPSNEPPCDPHSAEPANSMVDCGAAIPKICNVNGLCGNTREFHTTPTTTSPYTPNTWPELTTAFCGSIENNSFLKFTAGASSLGLRVFGSCSTGSGIQMMVFEKISGTTTPCDNGGVRSFGCFGNMRLTPAPANGVPITFTGMTPGNEYFLMIDGFGGSECDYKVAADYGVQISVDVTPDNSVICLGSSVNLSAVGGNGAYTWDNSPYLDTLAGDDVQASPNSVGNYSFVVNSPSSDPECPSATDTAFVEVISASLPVSGENQRICLGDSADLVAIPGNTFNYAYWTVEPPSNVPPFLVGFVPSHQDLNIQAALPDTGLYKFIINESNQACGLLTDTVMVWVEDVSVVADNVDITCLGADDGTIILQSQNGIEFSIDSAVTYFALDSFPNLNAGKYYIAARSELGCVDHDSIEIYEGPQLQINAWGDSLICQNGSAIIHAAVTPAIIPQYRWNIAGGDQETMNVNPMQDTWYTVQGFNDYGCLTDFDSVFVELRDPLVVTIDESADICFGESINFQASVSGGMGTMYTFEWSNGHTESSFGLSYQDVDPDETQTYVVTVSDPCESTPVSDSLTIRVHPNPEPNVVLVEDYLCEPATFDLFLDNTESETANVYWDFSTGFSVADMNEVQMNPLMSGTYGVSVELYSDMGCYGSWSSPNFMHAMPTPVAKFNTSPLSPTVNDPRVQMREYSEKAVRYEWIMPGAYPDNSMDRYPEVVYPEEIVAEYPVYLKVYSAYDCVDSTEGKVYIFPEDLSFIPNSFTPNADDHNNVWRYEFVGIVKEEFEAAVYNRWGEQVFSTNDANEFWNGEYKGQNVQDGIYMYKIKTRSKYTGEELRFEGQLTVLN